MIFPIVLAGGSGTRLWPMSRALYPKQYLSLDGKVSLLQATVKRLKGLPCHNPLFVCNEEHRFLAAEQVRQIPIKNFTIILEPAGRNTAPAITLAALHAIEKEKDPVLLVLSADHTIVDTASFHKSIHKGLHLAAQDKLVTFGVPPRKPETGYGYIQQGTSVDDDGYVVAKFVEKPNLETALAYLKSGDYLWNSGIFMFRAEVYLRELKSIQPKIFNTCKNAMDKSTRDKFFLKVDRDSFLDCPNESIDYAVMEKTQDAVVVSMDAGWSDIGSWSSLWETSNQDEQGNVFHGDIISKETTNTFILGKDKLVVTLGVADTIVIDTKDVVLVAHKDKAQEIKSVVKEIKESGRSEHLIHKEVFRPWGSYESINTGSRYQVKRITVNPGEKLSLQMHHHRAEHWVVVSGTARVTNGKETFLLTENQSTFIPIGQTHALENPGIVPLEMIEVQSGSYLGEDDIIRFEDIYGRL